MSKLLINERPLVILPGLAKKVGLNEAIILQQIHYWTDAKAKANTDCHDGRYWAYNTYEGWQEQFPFWSVSTIRRTISALEKAGYLITGNYNKSKFDSTKWYAINYELLKDNALAQNEHADCSPEEGRSKMDSSSVQNDASRLLKMNRPIPESNQRVLTNTTPLPPEGETEKPNVYGERFAKFWEAYPRKQAKGNAEKAFKRLKVSAALLDKMLDAIAWQKTTDEWKKDNGQFIPHPASWLNSARWEDEKSNYTTPASKFNFVN